MLLIIYFTLLIIFTKIDIVFTATDLRTKNWDTRAKFCRKKRTIRRFFSANKLTNPRTLYGLLVTTFTKKGSNGSTAISFPKKIDTPTE